MPAADGLLQHLVPLPDDPVPPGYELTLPGRGTTWVTDVPHPDPEAPTVVLLHALATTGMLCWYPSVQTLRQDFRVVVFDQRWHGRGFTEGEFTLADCAHDAAAVVTALGIRRAIFGGFSLGSLVAQRVWRQHPDVVGGLVLGATSARFANSKSERVFHSSMFVSMGAARTLNRSKVSQAAGRAAAAVLDLDDEDRHRWALREFRSISPWALGPAVAAIGRHHSTPWLAGIDVPTAVVVTEHDRVIRPERQRHVASLIPGATVHPVDGGHAAVVLQASRFVPVLHDACRTVADRMKVD